MTIHACTDLQNTIWEKEEAIAALRVELDLHHSQELDQLQTNQRVQMKLMSDSLSQKAEELSVTQSELSHLRVVSNESERNLGSANGHIKDLQEELARSRAELQTTREKRETSKQTAAQLKVHMCYLTLTNTTVLLFQSLLEGQRTEHEQAVRNHREQLEAVRQKERDEAEQKWTQRLKYERQVACMYCTCTCTSVCSLPYKRGTECTPQRPV